MLSPEIARMVASDCIRNTSNSLRSVDLSVQEVEIGRIEYEHDD